MPTQNMKHYFTIIIFISNLAIPKYLKMKWFLRRDLAFFQSQQMGNNMKNKQKQLTKIKNLYGSHFSVFDYSIFDLGKNNYQRY